MLIKKSIQNQAEHFFMAFEVSAIKRDYFLNAILLDDKENYVIAN